ncbi:hypothetical protein HPB48_004739 [Haemaphysalis longicornis]|uniref:Uncharacterized protein n=1 Tax=Haemaphysalis longicornis TaxID=44386 RepID=A0A9J6G2K4_HAELO|nr:hypothetical protein HPB48_004739 [Haemaphysalis longicornis]
MVVSSEPHHASWAPGLNNCRPDAASLRQSSGDHQRRSLLGGHPSSATRGLQLSSALAVIIPVGWLLQPHVLLAGTPLVELLSRATVRSFRHWCPPSSLLD